MPRDKGDTHRRVRDAAMREFLEKGFERTTMRDVAGAAGITAAGLYRHFADKEAMFAAMVEPFLKSFRIFYEGRKTEDYEYLEQGNLDGMWQDEGFMEKFLSLMYEYRNELKLLLCCSEGTRYASFLHDFVMLQQKETLAYMAVARERGVPVREVDLKEIHLLMTAYSNALFEVIVHDFTREEASHYIRTLYEFFSPGWRAVLGL